MIKENKKTNKRKQMIVLLIVGIMSFSLIFTVVYKHINQPNNPNISLEFQDCINKRQLVIFYSPTCPHCENMKEKLKDYKNIEWINCYEKQNVCSMLGVTWVPGYGVHENNTIIIPLAGEMEIKDLQERLCNA